MNENETQVKETNNEGQPKTYTQEEVDALLQQETDRRVTSALKKAEAKNAEKLKEAEKLAKMNEEQKYAYELEQREAAIAEKEKALALHSSVLAWRIPGTGEPGGLPSMGHTESDTTEVT